MRYWILILILALAPPAMGQWHELRCPSESLSVESDRYLPDFTDWYSVEGCNRVEWSFSFIRTPKTGGKTIIFVHIDGVMSDSLRFDSDSVPTPGPHETRGRAPVQDSLSRLRISIDPDSDRGHFIRMLLTARYYYR